MKRRSNTPMPWEVWWADLGTTRGREQRGRRPVIVIGSALACRLPNGLAIVIPTTTTPFPVPYRIPVTLDPDPISFAMCEQIKSISLERLQSRHPCRTLAGPEQVEVRFAVEQMLF